MAGWLGDEEAEKWNKKRKKSKLPGPRDPPIFWHDTLIVDAGCRYLAALSVVSGWALPTQRAESTLDCHCTCWTLLFARHSSSSSSSVDVFDYCTSSMLFARLIVGYLWPRTAGRDAIGCCRYRSCLGRDLWELLCTESESPQREELSLWALKSFPLIN